MQTTSLANAVELASRLQQVVKDAVKPPSAIATSRDEAVIYMALVRGTRGYLVSVAHQINGCYASGWYDACAVMIRRFLETLIIECFETHNIQNKIKDANGDYFFLRDLVDQACVETSWTLGRNVRKALPKFKEVGDKSAHSRRFNAHREDIDKLMSDLRDASQELLAIAKLK